MRKSKNKQYLKPKECYLTYQNNWYAQNIKVRWEIVSHKKNAFGIKIESNEEDDTICIINILLIYLYDMFKLILPDKYCIV